MRMIPAVSVLCNVEAVCERLVCSDRTSLFYSVSSLRRFGGAKQLTLRYSVDSILIIAIELPHAMPMYSCSKIRYFVRDMYNLSSISGSVERFFKDEMNERAHLPNRLRLLARDKIH